MVRASDTGRGRGRPDYCAQCNTYHSALNPINCTYQLCNYIFYCAIICTKVLNGNHLFGESVTCIQ